MTNKECVERWAEFIIPAVFRAEDELLKTHPEWRERLANIPEDKVSVVAEEYCTAIAEIIVRASEDYNEEEGL
jgi:hypothetical protein